MLNRLVLAGSALAILAVGAVTFYWTIVRQPPELVVHTTVDRTLSESIVGWYGTRTGTMVLPQFDNESDARTLANLRPFESPGAQCDVVWSNDITRTIRLKDKGLLAPFLPSNAADIPATFKAKDGTWYGCAAEARVLLVNTELVSDEAHPQSIQDLVDPRWKGKIGIARPSSGTSATHAACLCASWGEERTRDFFRKLKANGVKLFSSNRQVALAVGNGEIAVGLTNSSDAIAELVAASPVVMIYPDRGSDQLGTLFIPTTVAVVRGARHQRSAEGLANFLLSADVAKALATSAEARIPLGARSKIKSVTETPQTVHAMAVDFETAAHFRDSIANFLATEFAENP